MNGMQQGGGISKQGTAFIRTYTAYVFYASGGKVRFYIFVIIRLILDDARHYQTLVTGKGNLNGFPGTLVGMYSAKKQEVVVGMGLILEFIHVDTMINRGRIT